MGNTQSSMGPLNLGNYGILSSIMNGFNLIISQFLMSKLIIHFWFQLFPILFLLVSLSIYNLLFPFLLIDLYLTFMMLLLLSGLSIMFLSLLSYTGLSKYSMLGCMSLMSQYMAYELMLTTLLLLMLWSYSDLNLVNYYLFLFLFNLLYFIFYFIFIILFLLIFIMLFNYLFFMIGLMCTLAELNSMPFDLPESESELVAGFITEYSSIYFSLMLLTEYANTMALTIFMIIIFSLIFNLDMMLLVLICLIRSTLNRLKFDELMTNCWMVILPLTFMLWLIIIIN